MTTDETSAENAVPGEESVVKVSKGQSYDASSITVLEGLEAVRKRPGMYIGSTGERGLHHCVYEVVDNSVDEALAGICDHIEVTILADGGLRVRDNGRGIPVNEHPTEHKPAVEVVMTILHAGGKFGNGGYAVSGGLHGVGVSVVNALSTRMETEVRRDGYIWRISFENGVPTGPLERGAQTDEHGTTQTFWANPDIFETTHYDFETLRRRFRQMAFLNKDLRITLTDERPTATPEGDEVAGETGEGSPTPGYRSVSYMYSGGLLDYVKHLNTTKKVEVVHPDVVYFEAEDREKQIQCEVAMQWTSAYSETLNTFANTINTTEGGTHEEGFRSALTSVINKYARDKGLLKDKDPNLSGDDIREGLTAIISVKLGNPQFEGQTKTKLGNTEARTFVQQQVYSHLTDWLDMHPNEAKDVIRKALQAFAARAGRARPARRRVAKACSNRRRCPASSRIARRATRKSARSSSSRAIPQEARPSTGATPNTRRSCRFAGKSSTLRRRDWTARFPQTRSRGSSRPSARASATSSTWPSSAITRSCSWPTPTSTGPTSQPCC